MIGFVNTAPDTSLIPREILLRISDQHCFADFLLLLLREKHMTNSCVSSSIERTRSETGTCPIDEFPAAIRSIADHHRPSRLPFFRNLAGLDRAIANDPTFLGQLHFIYQSAMHATRAAVYQLPHLNNPALRKRKLRIFIDDDGLADGDTHHYQLTRAFRSIGAKCVLE